MTWIRLDDGFPDHPKIATVGPLAGWFHVCGLCYAGRYLTDGFIPENAVFRLADFRGIGISHGMVGHDVEAGELIDALLDAGLWQRVEGGYMIHDYLEYNPSAEQVRQERQVAKERMQKLRGRQERTPDGTFGKSSSAVRPNIARTSGEVTPLPIPIPIPLNTPKALASACGVPGASVSGDGEEDLFADVSDPVPGPRHTAEEVRTATIKSLSACTEKITPGAYAWPGLDVRLSQALACFCEVFKRTAPTGSDKQRREWSEGMAECIRVVGYEQIGPLMIEFAKRHREHRQGYDFQIATPWSLVKTLGVLRDEQLAVAQVARQKGPDWTIEADLADQRARLAGSKGVKS